MKKIYESERLKLTVIPLLETDSQKFVWQYRPKGISSKYVFTCTISNQLIAENPSYAYEMVIFKFIGDINFRFGKKHAEEVAAYIEKADILEDFPQPKLHTGVVVSKPIKPYGSGDHWIVQDLAKVFPCMDALVKHPEQKYRQAPLCDVIVSLNDSFKWSRESIADWLETLDLDIRMQTDEIKPEITNTLTLEEL